MTQVNSGGGMAEEWANPKVKMVSQTKPYLFVGDKSYFQKCFFFHIPPERFQDADRFFFFSIKRDHSAQEMLWDTYHIFDPYDDGLEAHSRS